MMRAEFTFEKVVEKGEQKLKFVGFENILRFDELPSEYTKTALPPCKNQIAFWLYGNSDSCIYFSTVSDLTVGNVYALETIREHVVMAKKAGARLSEILKDLEKKNKNWKGITTITI
jgi:hypothetical protein